MVGSDLSTKWELFVSETDNTFYGDDDGRSRHQSSSFET